MSQFYPLQVSKVNSLTPNAVSVSFQVPSELKEAFSFSAGQYITIRYSKNGAELRRAYSLCSVPGQEEITIGIKKVPDGTFSVYANEQLSKGDILEVMPPEGRFVFEPRGSAQQIVAFAAGSGITPIMSIIQEALSEHPGTEVVLVYGNQSSKETMFLEQLTELQNIYSDRFFIHHLFSREKEENSMFGRIDKGTVNYVIRNKHRELDPDRFYVCGPLSMIETVRETLSENGVPEEKIFHELFTEPEGEDEIAETLEGVTRLEVTLDEAEYTLEMDQKSLLLDAVLNANIDAPYSCQGGVCSTCIARVTEGSAKMVKNQILSDSELEAGFILTCQAHPTSNVLKIDYDDV